MGSGQAFSLFVTELVFFFFFFFLGGGGGYAQLNTVRNV